MFKSEYYTTWDEYKEQFPKIADKDLKSDKIQTYEEAMFNFMVMLFL